jgi:hypothetical protein
MLLLSRLFVLIIAGVITATSAAPVGADGLSRRLSCEDWSNDIQPAEWGWAVKDCIKQGRSGDAVRAFYAYNTTILFDQQRVRDESAHVVKDELNLWIFSATSRDQFNAMKPFINEMRAKEGAFFEATCAALIDLGPPDYRPEYMIKRGMIPRKSEEDWQVEGFEAAQAWQQALEINGC